MRRPTVTVSGPRRQEPRGAGLGRTCLVLGGLMLLVQLYVVRLDHLGEVQFYRAFALNPDLVRAALAGEAPLWPALWPFLTSLFLHDGWMHLLSNLAFLAIFGTLVERHLGAARLLLLFFACGLLGGILQVAIPEDLGPPAQLVVGASGGLFGLMGAALTCGVPQTRPGAPQRGLLLALIAINAVIGLTSATGLLGSLLLIGWQAHLGGFLAGLALGRLLWRP